MLINTQVGMNTIAQKQSINQNKGMAVPAKLNLPSFKGESSPAQDTVDFEAKKKIDQLPIDFPELAEARQLDKEQRYLESVKKYDTFYDKFTESKPEGEIALLPMIEVANSFKKTAYGLAGAASKIVDDVIDKMSNIGLDEADPLRTQILMMGAQMKTPIFPSEDAKKMYDEGVLAMGGGGAPGGMPPLPGMPGLGGAAMDPEFAKMNMEVQKMALQQVLDDPEILKLRHDVEKAKLKEELAVIEATKDFDIGGFAKLRREVEMSNLLDTKAAMDATKQEGLSLVDNVVKRQKLETDALDRGLEALEERKDADAKKDPDGMGIKYNA